MPEITEPIDVLNQRLIDHYGRFENGDANWRLVWSPDQYEKRYGVFEKHIGDLYLGKVEGVFEVPKYQQYLPDQYVLERLLPVPALNRKDLVTNLSYEPVWGFHDAAGFPLPPKWEAIKLIIDSVYRAAARTVGVKYKDPMLDPKESIEINEQRVKDLEKALFGNESPVGDALAHKDAIVVPRNYGVD